MRIALVRPLPIIFTDWDVGHIIRRKFQRGFEKYTSSEQRERRPGICGVSRLGMFY
jgi:hypothetical protein